MASFLLHTNPQEYSEALNPRQQMHLRKFRGALWPGNTSVIVRVQVGNETNKSLDRVRGQPTST